MDSLKVCHHWRMILILSVISGMCAGIDLEGFDNVLTNKRDAGTLDKFIVGGKADSIIRNPWLAFLSKSGRFFCGGSIIKSRWIITAAHCLYGLANPSTVTVTVGVDKISSGGTSIVAEKFFIHKDYDSWTLKHDLALIYLKSALNYTQYIRNINLATTMPADGTVCKVSGHGVTSGSTTVSDQLQTANVPILSDDVCYKVYDTKRDIQFCAGEAGKDSCQGDSGGPLVCDDKLTGIVSYGRGCAREGWPGVYVKVCNPLYLQWIQSTMNSLP